MSHHAKLKKFNQATGATAEGEKNRHKKNINTDK